MKYPPSYIYQEIQGPPSWTLKCYESMKTVLLVSCASNLRFQNIFSTKTNFRAAVAELLKEAERGSTRAEVGGSLAWKKPPKVNHRLFKNTLAQVVVGNIRKDITKAKNNQRKTDKD
jgi:hypothetical protein